MGYAVKEDRENMHGDLSDKEFKICCCDHDPFSQLWYKYTGGIMPKSLLSYKLNFFINGKLQELSFDGDYGIGMGANWAIRELLKILDADTSLNVDKPRVNDNGNS